MTTVTATHRVMARTVVAGTKTLADIPDKYTEGIIGALVEFEAQGIITESELATLLGNAVDDGVIEIPDEEEEPEV